MALLSSFSSTPQLVAQVAAPVTQIANAAMVVRSLTIAGATPDMTFVINWPSMDAGLLMGQANCDVAGTVKLQIYNTTGSPITPSAATLHVVGL